jgi:hypothetical protein
VRPRPGAAAPLSCGLAALALSLALAAQAGALATGFRYGPSFRGKLDDYGFAESFTGIGARNATIARGCPERKRGVLLKATADDADGFFQIFPDGALGPSLHADTCVDVAKLRTAGAFAGFELASPPAPPGTPPEALVFVGVVRQLDATLTLFAATADGTLPTAIPLPADTPAVRVDVSWDGSEVDVLAGACDAPSLAPLALDVPLAWAGSASFGAGMTRAGKRDAAGFAFFVTGDLYADAKRDLLEDLQAAIDLENGALVDLGNGMDAEAREKLEQARKRIEEQGPQVPDSDPPEYEPDLLEKLDALPGVEPEVRADLEKRLGKAAERDAKARDRLDRGRPADLKEARKQAEKALQDKLRAKAVLETGVVAEGKGRL